MSYTSAKYGLSKRYTNRCVLHHCKFLVSNKSWKDIPYVRVSGHKSEASIKSYARKLSSSTKHAISGTFSRACASPNIFLQLTNKYDIRCEEDQ